MASSGSFSTWNNLRYSSTSGITYSEGNCKVETTSGYPTCMNNFAPKSGKWYVEFYNHENNGYNVLGIVQQESIDNGDYGNWLPDGVTNKQFLYYSHNGNKSTSGVNTSYGSSWGSGNQIIGCALDLDNGKVWWSKNGVFQASGDPAAGTNAAFDNLDTSDGFYMAFSDYNGGADGIMGINCGQDSTFGGATTAGGNADDNGFGDFKYAPPTGFLAMCTANLPIATALDPAETDDDFPSKQFGEVLYTGNSTNGHAITGLGFQPDLVWIQRRSGGSSFGNGIIDSSRGVGVGLYPDRTDADTSFTSDFQSFDSDGFTLKAGSSMNINNSGSPFVAHCWRANGGTTTSDSSGSITVTRQTNDVSKFSILTYTGNGSSGSTIAHGLGVKPAMTIIKQRNSTNGWNVWHQGNNNGDYDSFGELNSNAGWYQNQGSNGPYTADPTSSLLTLSAYGQVNGSGNTYVAYVWADVEGMQKFGFYEGNGNENGPYIYMGFRPRLVVIKAADSTQMWAVCDTARETANPLGEKILQWNTSDAEFDASGFNFDIVSNGIKIRKSDTNINSSGATFLYMAWGDVPFKYANSF